MGVESMCLSGGLGSCVILSKIFDVQSCEGWCCRYVLHATIEGLIVTIIAYMIRGGGWCYVVVCGYIGMEVKVLFGRVGGAYFGKKV